MWHKIRHNTAKIALNKQTVRYKAKAFVLGTNNEKQGILKAVLIYFVLISLALIYIAPIVSMLSTSLKVFSDLIDPTTKWIPKSLHYINYKYAFDALNIAVTFHDDFSLWENLRRSTLFNTLTIVVPTAALQVLSCAVAGYAFGRMTFPFQKLLFVMLLLTFVIPPQTLMIPLIWTYKSYGLLDSPFAFIAPALFGHGIKGALFVFMYMQFFKKFPKELEEAAIIDGVGVVKMFWRVMLPLAKPAIVVVFLFSVVFHWNESMLTSYFYSALQTLPIKLGALQPEGDPTQLFVLPVKMAAGIIELAPLLILYFFTQRWFTESIERTGLVE
ncbi:carbohydrate ABC transporter permease [Paenibacillus spongiae]|uniref:Carbohydrate ABC transporter permease n=1 Tax=Paenibacillus spongiae TaxID=2909671 RepID=A0ABY5SJ69_9BACL|nr:carbohydrate ABC transporter permease [Paenibacillus spongiae]UVI33799.1 carbohydrate ABC transporter permease [Paenibacillus spongiae]